MVVCLERGADCLHMVQLMSLHPKTPSSLASFKSRQVYLSGTGVPRVLDMALCLCPSQGGVLSKRMNNESHCFWHGSFL